MKARTLFLAAATVGLFAGSARADAPDLRVGASAVNLKCDGKMVLAGFLESRYTEEQEGELRSVAVVVEKPGQAKLAIVACDVLWIPRSVVDAAVAEIERTTGIPAGHVLVNATHTHHAPSTAPAHGFGVSPEFAEELRKGIVRSVQEANANLAGGDARFFFRLGEEKTVGANSRLRLPNDNITWLNPKHEAGANPQPTGPFDPHLPVLDFRDPQGKSRALIFNHSTHTIGTRANKDVRSPSFYGLSAQELEQEFGGVVSFLEGASGSTHNIDQVPVPELIERIKKAVRETRAAATPRPVNHLAGIRRPLKFRVRTFDDRVEDEKIVRYTKKYAPANEARIREIFAAMRKKLAGEQGKERETWVQALVIGDVAIVGVPAEYFTSLGVDIKKRSPFKHTYVAELANDWIGYLPDREGHRLGGYQTWMGLHSYAEVGTGERIADEAVHLLEELAGGPKKEADQAPAAKPESKPEPGPKSPAEEKAAFRLSDPELEVELVAAEPDVDSPVAIAWDAAGRLYVAEMIGYPTAENLCRIRRLEDTDNDGKYDRAVTFADKLSFPASVMPYKAGILVATAPDVLYLEDSDGDGKADVRRVEWTGFVPGVQQLRANALHWGLDNWIYGANGRSDYAARRPNDPPAAAIPGRARDFRFDPRTNTFQPIVGLSQFGLCHDDWGQRFLSWNTIPVRHAVIEDRYLSDLPGLAPPSVIDTADPADSGRVYPISAPPRQFNTEQALYYNAMCGLTVYRGDALGPSYAGNAFVCESLTNLVTRRELIPDGPTFRSRRVEQGKEFLASADNWTHPVFLTTGPDGCLYVVDFYREFVEHPQYVADPKARASVDFRNGAGHGRIWRIRNKSFKAPTERPRLDRMSGEQLARALRHPVSWWRETAQRLLVERQDRSAVPTLNEGVRQATLPQARLHSLWTLQGLRSLDDATLQAALKDAEPRVRRSALELAEERLGTSAEVQNAVLAMTNDADPGVRFQLALALKSVDTPASAAALATLLGSGEDVWMTRAALCAASRSPDRLAKALLDNPTWGRAPTEPQGAFLEQLGQLVAAKADRDALTQCLTNAAKAAPATRLAFLAGLEKGLEGKGGLNGLPDGSPGRAAVNAVVETAVQVAAASNAPAATRVHAISLIGGTKPAGGGKTLTPLLAADQPPTVQLAAARAVAQLGDPAACREVYERWPSYTSAARREVLAVSTFSPAAAAALLDALEAQQVAPVEVPQSVRDSLARLPGGGLAGRARKILAASATADRQNVIDRYQTALTLAGDQRRGAALFKEHCATCHAIQGVGQKVGPDLAAVGSRRNDILLVDILDPSRQVSADFLGYVLATRGGKVLTGMVTAETAGGVTLRREGGVEESVARTEIEELRPSGKSLMPEGFEQKMRPEQIADILEFLRRPDPALLR